MPYLDGVSSAPTAEALMRSRYVAYAIGRASYLLDTWHSTTRPATLDLSQEPIPNCIGLAVKQHSLHGSDDTVVEFVARYKIAGRAYRLHETSRFIRENGRWFYVDGDIAE
jgi:SEC-C motif-containing protein